MEGEIDVGTDDRQQSSSTTDNLGPIFPLSRVKKIMKTDKDVHMCTAEAVALTAMAAEKFLEFFSEAVCRRAVEDKKKSVTYKEAVGAVNADPRLEFLTPLIPPTIPLNKALEFKKAINQVQMPAEGSDEEPDVVGHH